jgi:tetratricopeptide (TPR) repeat protein
MTTFASQTTTVITAPNPASMSPLEGAMMDACNELHEVISLGDDARARELEATLVRLMERYEATNAEDHPHPRWAIPHHRALFMSAAGDAAGAVIYEEIALQHAQTDRQREISLGNLAERYMRLERFDEAVEHFFKAREVAPRSVPIMLTGAQALYLAGFRAESDRIFRALLSMPHLLTVGSDLTAYLDFETRLQAMRPDLPSLDRLMSAWESLRGEVASEAEVEHG